MAAPRDLSSRTYQLSWKPNETNRHDDRNFSHSIPRRMPAEVAYDAIQQATASDERGQEMKQELEGRASHRRVRSATQRPQGPRLRPVGLGPLDTGKQLRL
ncbi:MAG: hypothetical protein CM1200mP2_50080 [Planctomycetaceae bacterium]|nr:MAG: hypothetical protein CM1200mP2_50080 [Planctomycetaceae bacterium]